MFFLNHLNVLKKHHNEDVYKRQVMDKNPTIDFSSLAQDEKELINNLKSKISLFNMNYRSQIEMCIRDSLYI